MITFEQALAAVERDWPDYELARHGFETDRHWLLVILPERMGGRIPAVVKATGVIEWVSAYSDEYREDRPVSLTAGTST